MGEHRFTFERPGSQHTCPNPNHKGNARRQFTRYVDLDTEELLPDHVGICNNVGKCGYSYTAIQFLQENPHYLKNNSFTRKDLQRRAARPTSAKPVSLFPGESVTKSLCGYDQNNFVKYLSRIFPSDVVSGLIERYKIGTSQNPWPGSVIFWQIDQNGNTRTGKIMLYDPATGKRVKEPFNHFHWAHVLLKKFGKAVNFDLQQCLYGEHLITLSDRIAVVEAEKTAIIASVFFPQYVWLATGGLNNLNPEKFKVLRGKEVTLFPDKGCYGAWTEKGKRLGMPNVRISSYIETLSVPDGGDLADYLPYHAAIPQRQPVNKGYPAAWDF